MINDQQRREVAAGLRANAALGPNVLFDLHEAVGDATYTQAGLLNCLADLIDRQTCEDVSVSRGDGFTPYVEFKCSACGCSHVSLTYVYYCPNCGAEVVNDAV